MLKRKDSAPQERQCGKSNEFTVCFPDRVLMQLIGRFLMDSSSVLFPCSVVLLLTSSPKLSRINRMSLSFRDVL